MIQTLKLQTFLDQYNEWGLKEDILEPGWSEGYVMSSKDLKIQDADISMNDARDG